jgi:glucose-6-phosphate 1-dehydrogenase
MAKIIPVSVFDFVVFGATGDLTLRKLLPALYYRFRDGQMPADSRVVGAARSALTDDAYRDRAQRALEEHVLPDDLDPAVLRRFLACLR